VLLTLLQFRRTPTSTTVIQQQWVVKVLRCLKTALSVVTPLPSNVCSPCPALSRSSSKKCARLLRLTLNRHIGQLTNSYILCHVPGNVQSSIPGMWLLRETTVNRSFVCTVMNVLKSAALHGVFDDSLVIARLARHQHSKMKYALISYTENEGDCQF